MCIYLNNILFYIENDDVKVKDTNDRFMTLKTHQLSKCLREHLQWLIGLDQQCMNRCSPTLRKIKPLKKDGIMHHLWYILNNFMKLSDKTSSFTCIACIQAGFYSMYRWRNWGFWLSLQIMDKRAETKGKMLSDPFFLLYAYSGHRVDLKSTSFIALHPSVG